MNPGAMNDGPYNGDLPHKGILQYRFRLLVNSLFPRSRVVRGRSKCGFGNAPRDLKDVCLPLQRVGYNRACTLVIHDNDATCGDLAIRHFERRRNCAIGKQPFSTAQRQRIYL